MITLETTFVSGDGGFSIEPLLYRQVKRTAKVALYERSRNGKAKDFEVFVIKIDPKGKISKFPNGVVKVAEDDKEKYPSTGQFGITAWSFPNLNAAEQCFENLNKKENLPEDDEKNSVKKLNIPLGEFTVGEMATHNNVSYPQAFLFVKAGIEKNEIKFLREERRNAKGKPSKIYVKA